MERRRLLVTTVVLAMAGMASAAPYNLGGYWAEVDYWADDGSFANPEDFPYETIVVIDWNNTYGPYETEAHAWGYRWSGEEYVSDALEAICAAGPLVVTTAYGGAFVDDAFYNDPAIDSDDHTSAPEFSGWWWAGSTSDGGATWDLNAAGIDVEPLGHHLIEGLNVDEQNWTSETLTIPVPEPSSLALLVGGAAVALRRRR